MSEASNGSAGETEYPAVKRETHRQYTMELRRRIVEETFAPGASVSIVARRHDVNTNLLFEWRKRYRQGTLIEKKPPATPMVSAPDLLRIGVVDHDGGIRPLPVTGYSVPPPPEACKAALPVSSRPVPGMIEIELRCGLKVRVDAGFDESALRRVLAITKEVA